MDVKGWLRKHDMDCIELAALAVFACIIYRCALLGIDGHHDGAVFNAALDVLHGKRLYADAFYRYGALTAYMQAFGMLLFGENIWSLRVLTVLFYTLSFGMYYTVFKRIMPKALVIGSQVIWLFCAPFWITTFHSWSSVYALFFFLCAMKACMCYVDSGKPLWMLLCGVSGSLAFWCRQPVGLVLLAAMLLCLWGIRLFRDAAHTVRKGFLYGLAGYVLTCVPFFLLFLIQGSLRDWWGQSIGGAFRFAGSQSGLPTAAVQIVFREDAVLMATRGMGEAVHKLLYLLKVLYRCLLPFRDADDATVSSGVFLLLPLAVIYLFVKNFAGLCAARKKHVQDNDARNEQVLIVAMCVFALASWHQYYPVSDVRHWYWAGFPMMGLLVYMVYEFVRATNRRFWTLTTLCIVFVLCGTVLHERFVAFRHTRSVTYTQQIDRSVSPYLAGLKLSEEQVAFYTEIAEVTDEIVERYPEVYFYNSGFCDMLDSVCNGRTAASGREGPVYITSVPYDGFTDYYLYRAIDQNYREQEMAEYENTIYFYLPDKMVME